MYGDEVEATISSSHELLDPDELVAEVEEVDDEEGIISNEELDAEEEVLLHDCTGSVSSRFGLTRPADGMETSMAGLL